MATPPTTDPLTQTDAPIQTHIVVDDDADSSVDDRLSIFTASLTSSALDYPTEHGRRYHAYRAGAYPMPNDAPEQERLDLTHHLMVLGIGKKLYLAPVEMKKVHRILDVGTGTGIWAIEIGDLFPHAEVLGSDLSAIQPNWLPPNVKFEIDDVESPWVYDRPFDFIFSRYMAGSILDWPKFIGNVYDNLSSGGWAEFQDYNGQYQCDDGSLTEDHSTRQWITGLIEAGNKLGRNPMPGPHLEGWVKEAGFKNVVHQEFKLPIGPWPQDAQLKQVGLYNIKQVLDGLEGFSLRLYGDVLGWSEVESHVLLAKVRQELMSGKIHCYVNFHVVYGQKE